MIAPRALAMNWNTLQVFRNERDSKLQYLGRGRAEGVIPDPDLSLFFGGQRQSF